MCEYVCNINIMYKFPRRKVTWTKTISPILIYSQTLYFFYSHLTFALMLPVMRSLVPHMIVYLSLGLCGSVGWAWSH